MEDNAETKGRIQETVRKILEESNMDAVTESKIRKQASKQLGIDLSLPHFKAFVKQVVEAFLQEKHEQQQQQQDEEEEQEQEWGSKDKEYDDDGDLIICKLSDKRRVTIQDFRGKTLFSIQEHYRKDGKDLPSSKVIKMARHLKRSELHMRNIKRWAFQEEVKNIVENTCFSPFLKLRELLPDKFQIPLTILEALRDSYDDAKHCFRLGNVENPIHIDFGLEDILHITGLPIDGIQVSGYITRDPIQIVMEHLNLDLDRASQLLTSSGRDTESGMIRLETLRDFFQDIPENSLVSSPEVKAKAFILYMLGTIIVPRRARTVMPDFLPLLDLQRIDSYAWGAAALSCIKDSLSENISSICCFTWALAVFALERFPIIRAGLVPPSEQPLCLGWINVAHREFKKTRNMKTEEYYKNKFLEMSENDVDWTPYGRLPVPDRFGHHLHMKYALVPCICFYAARMVRPDLCFKQLGLEEEAVKEDLVVPQIKVVKPSKHRDFDLLVYEGTSKKKLNYKELNDIWTNRNSYMVIETPQSSPAEEELDDGRTLASLHNELHQGQAMGRKGKNAQVQEPHITREEHGRLGRNRKKSKPYTPPSK